LCAPDRETDATVALFRAGERVTEIRPTRFLARSSDVILLNPPVFELPEFEFTADPPRCLPAFDWPMVTPVALPGLLPPTGC
jgi:hypothetical protein